MLEIKPIQTKADQETACTRCGIPYDQDCMAYAAHEDGEFIGMCQFNIEAERGYIKNLALREGLSDFEALFLLGRATLNFIDLCGIHKAACSEDAAEERVVTAIGFRRGEDGVYLADMTHMFEGCGGESAEKMSGNSTPPARN